MVRLSDAGVLSHPGVASRRSSATSSHQWQPFLSISPKVLVPPGAFAMAQHPDRGRITTLLPANAPASTERPPSSWCPTCLAVAGCSQRSMNEGGQDSAVTAHQMLLATAPLHGAARLPQTPKSPGITGSGACHRRPCPAALRCGSPWSATVHKSLRESDAPGQPKSLRNRRFCRVSLAG